MNSAAFDEQIQAALDHRLTGWDFSWLHARTVEEPLPWDYRAIVLERMRGANALLDIGTGGGEFLAGLAPLPPHTRATEGYPPNVPLARARLQALGVPVADVSAEADEHLPYDDGEFDLVIDRHAGVNAWALARVLKPGGRYVTQQVGGENCMDINRFLEDKPSYVYQAVSLANDTRKLREAGLEIIDAREAFPAFTFQDVAGVVFYLESIPWQVTDFSVEKYREKLYEIYRHIQQHGGWTVREHRYLIEAAKI